MLGGCEGEKLFMPMISVIMGVYNCKDKELLFKSVNSIIQQSYTDWEFIICNDGSTDDTLSVLKKLELLDNRIRIISYERNQGLSYALNKCISCATGKYIARQDDDDISYPSRFEEQINFIREHNEYEIVGTIADVYDDNGIWGEYNLEEMPSPKTFLWNSPFLHPSVIIRKQALDVVGGYRVAKETSRCEDYDLFMRMYVKGMKGYNIQKKLYKYRIVNGNKKYRPMKDRLDEARVRYKGFCKLGLMPSGFVYVLKPLIIGLIPQKIFKIIKARQY